MKKEGACTLSRGRVRGDDEGRRRGPRREAKLETRREAKLETRREAEERRETTDGKNQDIRILPVYRTAVGRGPAHGKHTRGPAPGGASVALSPVAAMNYRTMSDGYQRSGRRVRALIPRHLYGVRDWFTREDDSPHKEVTVKLTIPLVL